MRAAIRQCHRKRDKGFTYSNVRVNATSCGSHSFINILRLVVKRVNVLVLALYCSFTMGKKSLAQLKRLRQRAEARGEVYVEPPASPGPGPTTCKEGTESAAAQEQSIDESSSAAISPTTKLADNGQEKINKKRRAAAKQLQKGLDEIAADSTLKAKERRAAKRKAEAIASEATSMEPQELLAWYQQQEDNDIGGEAKSRESKKGKKSNPYVAFVGQLSYQTTGDGLFAYLKENLGEGEVTTDTVKIRLLTKKKGDKDVSRGMAFVETTTPELLYSCLSLHHTHLDGRRINVERTAGGRNPLKRKAKIDEFRQEQLSHQREVIQGILQQHNVVEGTTVDAGVVQLCERHAASVVQAALERFESTNGPDKDNPSAYLTFLLTKLSEEGILDDLDPRPAKKQQRQQRQHRVENR
jgi:RNA recognition motif-containing protein